MVWRKLGIDPRQQVVWQKAISAIQIPWVTRPFKLREVKILRRQVKRNLESEDEEYKTQCISERVDEEGEEEEEEDIDNDYDEEEQNQNELDSVEKTLRMKEKRMLELAKKAGTNSSADELRKRYEELVEEVENERKVLVEERERVHQAF